MNNKIRVFALFLSVFVFMFAVVMEAVILMLIAWLCDFAFNTEWYDKFSFWQFMAMALLLQIIISIFRRRK